MQGCCPIPSPLRGGVDHSSFLMFSSEKKKRLPYRGSAPSSLLLRGGVDHSSSIMYGEGKAPLTPLFLKKARRCTSPLL
jgi:hypothetical protein